MGFRGDEAEDLAQGAVLRMLEKFRDRRPPLEACCFLREGVALSPTFAANRAEGDAKNLIKSKDTAKANLTVRSSDLGDPDKLTLLEPMVDEWHAVQEAEEIRDAQSRLGQHDSEAAALLPLLIHFPKAQVAELIGATPQGFGQRLRRGGERIRISV